MPGPIRPEEIEQTLPEEVFTAFNELIRENLRGRVATVYQSDAEIRVADKLSLTKKEVMDKGYLDVEDAYRKAGWKVEYDKPAYNESYEAFFRFTKK
jgi:hypothetical protein